MDIDAVCQAICAGINTSSREQLERHIDSLRDVFLVIQNLPFYETHIRDVQPPSTARNQDKSDSIDFHRKVTALLEALQRRYETIRRFWNRFEVTQLTDVVPGGDHPYILHFLAGGGSNPRPNDKIRKSFAELHSAEEYEQWEQESYGTSRIRALTKDQHSKGHLRRYVRHRGDYVDKIQAEKCTQHGIKLEIIQRCWRRSGIVGLLAFVSSAAKDLPIGEIPLFVEKFNEIQTLHSLATEISDRFDEAKTTYKAFVRQTLSSEEWEAFRKQQVDARPKKRLRLGVGEHSTQHDNRRSLKGVSQAGHRQIQSTHDTRGILNPTNTLFISPPEGNHVSQTGIVNFDQTSATAPFNLGSAAREVVNFDQAFVAIPQPFGAQGNHNFDLGSAAREVVNFDQAFVAIPQPFGAQENDNFGQGSATGPFNLGSATKEVVNFVGAIPQPFGAQENDNFGQGSATAPFNLGSAAREVINFDQAFRAMQ